MKKTYRFTLPQNKEVESTNIRVENCEVFVDVEFKEKFKPKDGDFLFVEGGVFIYNGKQTDESFGAYIGTTRDNKIVQSLTEDKWSLKIGVRYATDKEKSDFLSMVENVFGKRWNLEKKCLENVRWRAGALGEYYSIQSDFSIHQFIESFSIDDFNRYADGNYFRTLESAKKVADQIKEIFKTSKTE